MVNKEQILLRISEEEIFKRYTGKNWREKRKFKSPFREDTNPSCCFFTSSRGIKYFMDFGRGICWDAFQLVKEVHQCDFKSALKIINQDFGLNLDTKTPKKIKRTIEYIQSPEVDADPALKLDFIPCDWTDAHWEYWEKYGIERYIVRSFGVQAVETIISSGKITELNGEIAFAFTENLPYLKILRPFADKRSKWRNTCKKHQLHGDLWPFTKIQVVTKSLKDVMVLHQMGITALGVMSESADPTWYDQDTHNILHDALVLMDNDEAGKTCAAKWEEAGYKTIFVPEEYKAKDISDLVLEIGFENAKNWITSCLSTMKTQKSSMN